MFVSTIGYCSVTLSRWHLGPTLRWYDARAALVKKRALLCLAEQSGFVPPNLSKIWEWEPSEPTGTWSLPSDHNTWQGMVSNLVSREIAFMMCEAMQEHMFALPSCFLHVPLYICMSLCSLKWHLSMHELIERAIHPVNKWYTVCS